MSEGRRLTPPTPQRQGYQPGSGALPYAYESEAMERRAAMAQRAAAPHQATFGAVADRSALNMAQFIGNVEQRGLAAMGDFADNLTRGENVHEAMSDTEKVYRNARAEMIALGRGRNQTI